MRFTVLALTFVVAATSALDAQGQIFGRRRRARDCCAPPPQTCCQPAPVQTGCCAPATQPVAFHGGCCAPAGYGQPVVGQPYPQTLPGYTMAMPMPQTSSNPITQTGGVQAPDGHSATTTAQGQTPQPAPQGQPGAVPPYTGQSPVYGSGTAVIAGGECGCGTTVAYADGGARRRGLFRRY